MRSYYTYLNEGNINVKEIFLSFLNSKNIVPVNKKPKDFDGYLLSKNQKNFTIFSNDRLKLKEELHNFLNTQKIRFTENRGQSSIPETKFDNLKVTYKSTEIATKQSGAGAKQTAIQETAQSLVLSLSFNLLKRKLSNSDLTVSNLKDAYVFVDKNDESISALADFIFSSTEWTNTFVNTTNVLFDKYYQSGYKYTFERGSTLVDSIYDDYRALSKEIGIKAKDDKWNPSDIWLVSSKIKNLEHSTTLNDLNTYIEDKYNKKVLIGTS